MGMRKYNPEALKRFTPAELDEAREWRRQRRLAYERSPEGRRETWWKLAANIYEPIIGMTCILGPLFFLMWALNGF